MNRMKRGMIIDVNLDRTQSDLHIFNCVTSERAWR